MQTDLPDQEDGQYYQNTVYAFHLNYEQDNSVLLVPVEHLAKPLAYINWIAYRCPYLAESPKTLLIKLAHHMWEVGNTSPVLDRDELAEITGVQFSAFMVSPLIQIGVLARQEVEDPEDRGLHAYTININNIPTCEDQIWVSQMTERFSTHV